MSDFGSGFRETLQQVASDRSAKSALVGAIVLYSFFYPAPYRSQVATRQPVTVVEGAVSDVVITVDLKPKPRQPVGP